MKDIRYVIVGLLIAAGSFLFGFLIRQPKINKLRKQVENLQKNNERLLGIMEKQQSDFRVLLAQHKALKAINFGKKKKSLRQLQENLILQYAELDYLEILLKQVKFEHEMSKGEIVFFKAYDKVLNGKNVSTSTMVKIRDFTLKRHVKEISNLQECDISVAMKELNSLRFSN